MTQFNVKFDIYESKYSEEIKMNVVQEEPVATGLGGFFQQIAPTLESEITSGKEGDRLIRFRMLANMHPRLVEGTYIRLTHKKNPTTKMLVKQNVEFQYEVRSITPVDEGFREMNIALLPKDKELDTPARSGRPLSGPQIAGVLQFGGSADAED